MTIAVTISAAINPATNTIILTETAPATAGATPVSLTVQPAHRWASKADYARAWRDQLVTALTWLAGRTVDDSALAAGATVSVARASGEIVVPSF